MMLLFCGGPNMLIHMLEIVQPFIQKGHSFDEHMNKNALARIAFATFTQTLRFAAKNNIN